MKIKDFLGEGWNKRDAYQRDYDSSVSGFNRPARDMDDESNLLYIYTDGRVKQKMVSNRVEREARAQGFRDSPEQALKMHGIIRSKFNPKKWVQKQGDKWIEVHPFGEPVAEELDMDLLKAAQKGAKEKPTKKDPESERNAHKKYGYRDDSESKDKSLDDLTHPADRKKKVKEEATAGATSSANVSVGAVYKNKPAKQAKNKDGTAKNALDMKANLMTGGSIKR